MTTSTEWHRIPARIIPANNRRGVTPKFVHLGGQKFAVTVEHDEIHLIEPKGHTVLDAHSLSWDPELLHCWVAVPDIKWVVTAHHSDSVLRASNGEYSVEATLSRVYSEVVGDELQFVESRAGPGGTLLILYEAGLICLGREGKVKWHKRHDILNATFASLGEEEICLLIQAGDPRDGEIVCFGLLDGTRLK